MITTLASSSSSDTTMVLFTGITLLVLLFWYLATDKDRVKRNVGSLIVLLIAVCSFFAIISPANLWSVIQGEKSFSEANNLTGGIEIVGGTSFLIEVTPNKDDKGKDLPLTMEAMDTAKNILERRLNENGTLDAPVTIQGKNRIEIQIPKIDPSSAKALKKKLTTTAKLTIHKCHPQSDSLAALVFNKEQIEPGYIALPQDIIKDGAVVGTNYVLVNRKPALTGKQIAGASPNYQSNSEVFIELTDSGAKMMEEFTRSLVPQKDRIVSVLDGKVVNNAFLAADVLSKNFTISGLDSLEECKELSKSLMNPLENDINIIDERTVSPTLGSATVTQGINAGLATLAITTVFILLYYRYSGIIALIGLALNLLILFGAMALFGASFTLPGIAGIILTIGIAVDANVLIYERMREELALGKSINTSIRASFEKAFSAIFDANITTLLTALVLYWKATGSVKGFAVTLTIGIVGTLIASLLCTRVLFWWSTDKGLLKKVNFMNLAPDKVINFLGMRKYSLTISLILVLLGIGGTFFKGDQHLGIDFVGGNITRFEIPQGMEIDQQEVDAVTSKVKTEKQHSSQIEIVPGSASYISIKSGREDSEALIAAIRSHFEGFDKFSYELDANGKKVLDADGNPIKIYEVEENTTEVSPTLGGEFLSNAIWALSLGMFSVLIYITLRYEFSFALASFLALVHDIIVTLGIIILTNQELSLIHVGAFLTIAGYSINDTIIIFDRLREDLKMKRGEIKDVMNSAISTTLSRTVITSLTTFVAVFILYIYGGDALKTFSYTIMIGLIAGTYSTIFVASPIVYIYSKFRGINLRRELLDSELETDVNPVVLK